MSSQVRERLSRVETRSRTLARRPFGLSPTELVVCALAVLFFVMVIVFYFTSVKPEQERLKRLEAEVAKQEDLLIQSVKPLSSENVTSTDTSQDALSTLESFRGQHLKPMAQGRIDLIKEINALAKKSNVQLTSGIEMVAEKAQAGEDEKENSRAKSVEQLPSAFPRIAVHFEVAGQYVSLRSFINQLESSRNFVVIDAVNLTSLEEQGPRGGQGGGLKLSLDLSAYFQP